MGLISVAKDSIKSILADQWREYFYCDAISNDILVVKGSKRNTKNNKGNDNIISNGSVIAVNEGQCMLIVDQGKIVEFSAEAGEFIYDASAEPSLLYGKLKTNIKSTFDTLVRRGSFAGDTAREQRVYYFNIKEIMGNLFGTVNPVPFRVVDMNIGLDMDIAIRCNGEFSYKITDPMLFYKNVCGNIDEEYEKANIASQLKSEFLTALQPAFANISALGVRYSAVTAHTMELTEALRVVLSQKWSNVRGIEIVSVAINSMKASEEDENMIKTLQKTAVMGNANMAAATLVEAQAEAMKLAAANTSTGSMMAFAGMNMANMVGGMNANTLFAMGQNQQMPNAAAMGFGAGVQPQMQPQAEGWNCSCGKVGNQGKFCSECGSRKPESDSWMCSCGTVNTGKFCPECGAKKR
jgi:membrane protease subunit (stomatin/prohibitin family)